MVQESVYGATNVTQYTTLSEFKEMHPKYFMNRDMLQNIPVQYWEERGIKFRWDHSEKEGWGSDEEASGETNLS